MLGIGQCQVPAVELPDRDKVREIARPMASMAKAVKSPSSIVTQSLDVCIIFFLPLN